VRLWIDRSFTIKGAGTVVTGTLGAGRLRPGDELELTGAARPVRIRGLQSLGAAADELTATARVAVNLRGVERLAENVILRAGAPQRAMATLAGLPQPFTLSEARRALKHQPPSHRGPCWNTSTAPASPAGWTTTTGRPPRGRRPPAPLTRC
jgi:GTPase